ncbi:MAG: type III secretion system domain-containing protein [Candidatus Symbiodolus clandestinus]
MIAAEIIRLHQLAWRPGVVMHFQWWAQLQLSSWHPYYLKGQVDASDISALLPSTESSLRDSPWQASLQQAIDRLICQKRRFPIAALPAQLSGQQCRLLALEDRLGKLLVALGLQLLGSPDYLLRGHYRRVLAPLLGWQALDQLWTLWRQGDHSAELPPEKLVEQAQQCAYQVLNSQLKTDPVWQTLLIQLPPPLPAAAPAAVSFDTPLTLLFRIARFL